MKSIRGAVVIKEGKVFLPVVTLKRGVNVVVLLSVIHVAPKSFFENILSRISAYETADFQILYEEVEAVPSTEKSKLDILFNGLKQYDLYSQLELIQPKTSWQSADLTQTKDHELEEIIVKEGGLDDSLIEPRQYIKEILIPQLENPNFDIPGFEIVVNKRNQFATNLILKKIKERNIATYWGSAHLPGIINLLEQVGFAIDKIEWVQAVDLGRLKALVAD